MSDNSCLYYYDMQVIRRICSLCSFHSETSSAASVIRENVHRDCVTFVNPIYRTCSAFSTQHSLRFAVNQQTQSSFDSFAIELLNLRKPQIVTGGDETHVYRRNQNFRCEVHSYRYAPFLVWGVKGTGVWENLLFWVFLSENGIFRCSICVTAGFWNQ